jgi:hypothetical protein
VKLVSNTATAICLIINHSFDSRSLNEGERALGTLSVTRQVTRQHFLDARHLLLNEHLVLDRLEVRHRR